MSDVDVVLIERQRPVVVLLTLVVAIMQKPSHQLFATQALHAYLAVLGKLPEEIYDFDNAKGPEQDLTFVVTKVDGGEPQTTVVRRSE